MLDLESEAMRGPGSIPTVGNILSLDFFLRSKASDAIIANFVNLRKTQLLPLLEFFIMNLILSDLAISVD